MQAAAATSVAAAADISDNRVSCQKQKRTPPSVTRFGQTFKNLGQNFEGLFFVWQAKF